MPDPVRLRAVLGTPAWAWWRERARREWSAGRRPVSLTNNAPTAEERAAANRLFNTPGRTGPVRVDHAKLEAILHEAGLVEDLAEALVLLDGPLADLVGERAADAAAWAAVARRAEVLRPLLGALGVDDAGWSALVMDGGLRRLAVGDPIQADALLVQATEVLGRLRGAVAAGAISDDPGAGAPGSPAGRRPAVPGEDRRPLTLAELAVQATGDAHALDRNRNLGRLVVRLLGDDDDAVRWRATWARFQITVDAVSNSVLVLNLTVMEGSDHPLRTILGTAASAGEPVRLTLRQLRDPPPFAVASRPVFVVENPTVVAVAAGALGARCPVLVCSYGRPVAAVLALLDRLVADGADLRIHGDLDWAGLAIASDLLARTGGQPWRLSAGDLLRHRALPGPALLGLPVATPWDPALATALAQRGMALHEEAVLDELLGDLRSGG